MTACDPAASPASPTPPTGLELAVQPDILKLFVQDLRWRGVVGEDRAAKLLYLALTSRLLDRPVSVAVKGPSSAGKSWVTDAVLDFFPPRAYYKLTAMSEKVLVYSEEPVQHRHLVINEASGLGGEFASYVIRSLLSERRLIYETVERPPRGGQWRSRRIEREGPTGLITTTTAIRIHPENETRLLSIRVNDTREQTRTIMREFARKAAGGVPANRVDLRPWHEFQEALAEKEHRVVIPYARALADKIPPVAVRLRRDFGSLLALIAAHALLHQATRQKTRDGVIVADLADYAAVRPLVADLMAEGADLSVPDTVRQTVHAVESLISSGPEHVTAAAVAGRLNLDPSTAWRRIQTALDLGYLGNLEEERSRPGRLVLGNPLPREQELLPAADRLQA